MTRTALTIPELSIIAGTRACAGAGLALLLANHLNPEQRRAVGWTLLAVGALSSIPIATQIMKSQHEDHLSARSPEYVS